MDNKNNKKLIKSPYYSLEKLSEDLSLVKRGLRDLGILPQIQTLLHEISIQFHSHNYQKCIELCDETLATEPNTLLFLCYKALSLKELGQLEDSLIWFDKALSIDSEFMVALCNKADILRALGRYEEAITLYDKIFIKEPDMIVHLVGNKGDALNHLNKHEEALIFYNQVLSIEPNNEDALMGKGGAFFGLGRYEDALISYNQVLSIEPNNGAAIVGIVNIGISLDNLDRHEEAIKMYDKVLIRADDLINNNVLFDLNRENRLQTFDAKNFLKIVFWKKSLALSDIGRDEEAIIMIDKVLDIDSTDKETYFNKGVMLYKLGKYQEAIEVFDKALEIDPQDADVINAKKTALSELVKTQSKKDRQNPEEDVSKQKFYVVPQTEEEIEQNRKKIEELRAKGLLQGHEKTFKIQKDGTVVEE